MAKFQVVDHPLIQHKLTIIRDKNTSTKQFREVTNEIAMLMAYEITRDLPLEDVEIETPLVKSVQKQIAGKKLAIIPILRAGLGMVDGMVDLIPAARIGHIGLYRDEDTLEAVEYFAKFPQDISERRLFVVDPMLATGSSAIAALDLLTSKYNVQPENITFVCLVSAPEGVKAFQEAYPDVDLYTAALDERLNEHGYILPGLGDAGDRIFGTK
ncbi:MULTISPECIES: uracil phosphoribosyltransferase [Globicatella]|uniref:uracil phosphoribosyltransferase n=1 Tax=Globicatella TaxID=13075 RepID=UPI0008252AD3|nr:MULTISPECIES: uracil phosphoribosyltransferase [Globicatella]HJF17451.1 uracil phosphoribosyltransferase [Globicatella sulfidifaciens]MDK7630262.1 uracil phosphoribosyltransferase [Globicatella sanguinis]OFK57874.1 uracil phosphoribosyltransferase [Globicatella sp. HMSC072A10]WIK67192.1 uracil phosphoribosyltransferase [Globicatella sanguinis]WKT56597.1 uracil phosphoribosyltransferase [Globicatella sanguinis]